MKKYSFILALITSAMLAENADLQYVKSQVDNLNALKTDELYDYTLSRENLCFSLQLFLDLNRLKIEESVALTHEEKTVINTGLDILREAQDRCRDSKKFKLDDYINTVQFLVNQKQTK